MNMLFHTEKKNSFLLLHDAIERVEKHRGALRKLLFTLLPGFGDDISGLPAHHFGDVERAVGLLGYSDGPIHSLCLHLVDTVHTEMSHVSSSKLLTGSNGQSMNGSKGQSLNYKNVLI